VIKALICARRLFEHLRYRTIGAGHAWHNGPSAQPPGLRLGIIASPVELDNPRQAAVGRFNVGQGVVRVEGAIGAPVKAGGAGLRARDGHAGTPAAPAVSSAVVCRVQLTVPFPCLVTCPPVFSLSSVAERRLIIAQHTVLGSRTHRVPLAACPPVLPPSSVAERRLRLQSSLRDLPLRNAHVIPAFHAGLRSFCASGTPGRYRTRVLCKPATLRPS
jgi:hypothetical protein